MLDTELLDLAVKIAEHESERWDQASWAHIPQDLVNRDDLEAGFNLELDSISCGTSACIAGHIAVLAGAKFVVTERSYRADNGDYHVADCVTPDGHTTLISEFARKTAGMETDEAYRLFSGSNTIDDIKLQVAAIKRNHKDD